MSRGARILGWSLLTLLVYATLGAMVFFVSFLALERKQFIDAPWFASAQGRLYREAIAGSPRSWLNQPGCIKPDPELIYVPAHRSCEFQDIEFSTTLTFTDEGRYTGRKPEGTGIAVIGDSHAMGWGVNDEETFAAHLQLLTGRPVYNLAVASYGTARELIRLRQSGVLDKVDTVILQYCNNDRNENLHFDAAEHHTLHDKVFNPMPAKDDDQSKLTRLTKGYLLALAAPIRRLADRVRRRDFAPHYEPMMAELRRHAEILHGKDVVVFYSNPYGLKYRNFPAGPNSEMPNVRFADLGLDQSDYRQLDNHLTPAGHRRAAERLHQILAQIASQ